MGYVFSYYLREKRPSLLCMIYLANPDFFIIVSFASSFLLFPTVFFFNPSRDFEGINAAQCSNLHTHTHNMNDLISYENSKPVLFFLSGIHGTCLKGIIET